MTTITQTLRNAAVNGVINIDKAIKALEAFDEERTETVDLLRQCEKNVGMDLGENINSHVAKMTGGHFSATEYFYEKPNGGAIIPPTGFLK